MPARLLRALPVALVATLTGCGPVTYVTEVTRNAARLIDEARNARADKLAPYEYTAALEYLAKAREVGGLARFSEATAYARKSQALSQRAIELAGERTGAPGTGSRE